MCLVRVVFPRKFKSSKFQTLAKLAICRSTFLKNQQEARYFLAKSDIIDLLKRGEQDSALRRVQLVMEYDNMIEAFTMIQDYCHLLAERVELLQTSEDCPCELKEAVASLIFASSRIGEFPELKRIRRIIISRFGKELADRAIELRNNCGVNPKIIRKLSNGQPSLKSKYKALQDIASENGAIPHLEDPFEVDIEEKSDTTVKMKQQESNMSARFSDSDSSYGSMRKYKDATEAAQDAAESASYAAEAARLAVKLSRQESLANGEDYYSSSSYGSDRKGGGSMYVFVGR